MRSLLLCLFLGLCCVALTAQGQERTVSGIVTSQDDGSGIPGVNVVLKGTANGTATDADGRYSIVVPASGGTLVFSFIGMDTKEVEIGAMTTIDVVMGFDILQLNEVVVTAGGLVVQRRELGTQVTTVNATDITQGKSQNPVAGLQGKVPGLLISAVSSGVNPSYRVVLRGQRSLLGNNQALLVLDGIITPNSVLGNLNPEDILDIQVLNGAGAAALYGSDASNGALIVTTKRGQEGKAEIKVSNTTTLEQVSFLPKLQSSFGPGSTPDTPPVYTPYENQQYGPRFDGSIRPIGKPLADGSIQEVRYSPTDARNDFWETGLMNQTDFSLSSGDDKGTIYAAAQYFRQESTVPWDEYQRYSFRVNTDRKIGKTVKASVSTNYIANRYDVSWRVGNAYTDVLMSPANVDITKYRDWRNDPFANPNGYYNEYYDNPYFTLANNREETKNNYFQGALELKWNPIEPLTFTGRVGLSTRGITSKYTTGKFIFSDYTKSISGSKTDIAGFVGDATVNTNQLVGDLYAEYKKDLSQDFSMTVVAGVQSRDNTAKYINVAANGLVISDVYNVSNTLTNLGVLNQIGNPLTGRAFDNNEGNYHTTQYGVYADVRFGYKDFAFLHFTGRNDWRSVLAKENRSFFYPAVDASVVLSDAIQALGNLPWLNALKVRGGYSQVGQVNIGAYELATVFGQQSGFPYPSGGGFSLGDRLVSPSLEPEMTTGLEAGFDLDLRPFETSLGFTIYKSNTENQTIPVQLPSSSGYSSLLTNVGEVQNRGLETFIRTTPIDLPNGLRVTVQASYTLNRNEVVSLADDADLLILPGGATAARVVAKVGQPFPLLQVTKYKRTPEGKIIVDPVTGYPSTDGSFHDVGTTTPPHIVGLSAEVKFRNWRLAGSAEYRNGHFVFNNSAVAFDFSGAGIRTAWYNRERFVIPNSAYEDPENPGKYIDNTNITTSSGGADFWTDQTRNRGIGENYTNSAGFWKIREISLRYMFPSSALSGVGFIKSASISVQGRNLFIRTPKTNLYTDPEYSANGADSNAIGFTNVNLTPPARYMGATLSLTF